MEVWKISGKCDDRNSIIVDLKTSVSFEVWTCSIKCGKNSREDERESFKFNEYSHRAGYKLLKTSCNADNLGFENIKTNQLRQGEDTSKNNNSKKLSRPNIHCYELPLFLFLRHLNLPSL